jgi:hypothetical protein
LLWHHPRWLAIGMFTMMLAGLGSWLGYRRLVRRISAKPDNTFPS